MTDLTLLLTAGLVVLSTIVFAYACWGWVSLMEWLADR